MTLSYPKGCSKRIVKVNLFSKKIKCKLVKYKGNLNIVVSMNKKTKWCALAITNYNSCNFEGIKPEYF